MDGRPGAYRQALTVMLLVIAAGVALGSFPEDDGLRHVGLAFGEPRSWGDVYPHSVFAEHAGYDPWWGYDRALRGVAAAARLFPVPRIAAAIAVVKLLALGFLAGFLLLSVRRSGLEREVRSPAGLAAAAALVAAFLGIPAARILALRPFAFGSLYLLLALPGGGALLGIVAAGALAALYPYLFWVYTLPVGVAHLLKGDRRFGAGTLVLTAAVAAAQPPGFRGLLAGLARAEAVRASLAPGITEFKSLAAEPLLAAAAVLVLLCALPSFPAARRLGVPQLLMIFFAPASVRYVRYLIDVELVLLFVIFGAAMTSALAGRLERIGSFWAAQARRARLALAPRAVRPAAANGGAFRARPLIAALGVAVLALAAVHEARRIREVGRLAQALETVPAGSLVLADFNLQYRLLFARPDLRVVPSCELGFASDAILPAYRAYFNEGDPCALAHAVGAGWFVGPAVPALAPERSGCLGPRSAGGSAAAVVRPILQPATGGGRH